MSPETVARGRALTDAAADDIAVELKSVTKRYLFRGARLRGLIRRVNDADAPGFTALRDVDLQVRRGERLGVVGRNGAGKTTLLRLVAGSSAATAGEVRVDGEVQALMQLGVGYHPEFTGRDNIRSSLTHLGLADEGLEQAMADVVEFVELGEHLDQPLRTYSLGMRTRLMFATATAVQPDVLVIDEVLGAGDPYFTAKSADRVRRMVESGCTLLLVSHSTQQMLQFCERVVWLDQGRIVQDGESVEVLNAYEAYIERASEQIFSSVDGDGEPEAESGSSDLMITLDDGRAVHSWPGREGVKIRRVSLAGAGLETPPLKQGMETWIEFDIVAEVEREFSLRYLITFWRNDGRRVARVENTTDRIAMREGDRRTVRADLGPLLLGPGDYTISFSVYDMLGGEGSERVRYDVLSRAIRFAVTAAGGPEAATVLPGHWRRG